MKKTLATLALLVLIVPSALAAYPLALARQAPTTPGAPWPAAVDLHASDLEILDLSVGADRGDEGTVSIRIQNPSIVQGGEELSIWQFVVSVPAGSGVDLFTSSRINLPNWIVYDAWPGQASSNICQGPENLAGVPGTSCDVLIFEADKNYHLRPGGEAVFTLDFEVDATVAYCEKVPISIYGVHLRQDEAIGFTHTGLAPLTPSAGRQVTMVIDDLGEDPELIEDASEFLDLDHNGHIDTVRLQFNKELDPLTIDKDDFRVTPSTPDLPRGDFTITGATVKMAPLDFAGNPMHPDILCPTNSLVELTIEEKDLLDTGDAPEVTFRERSGASRLNRYADRVMHTLANQRMTTQGPIEPLDRARPVLASALTFVFEDPNDSHLNDRVLLTFSEPVLKYADAACSGTGADLVANDVLFVPWDEINKQYGALQAGTAGGTMVHRRDPGNTPDDRRMWLIFAQGSNDLPFGFTNTEHRFKPHDSAVEREPNGDDAGDPQPHRFGFHPNSDFVCDEARNRIWDDLNPGDLLGTCPPDPPTPPATLCQQDWYPRLEPLSVPSIIKVEGDVSHDWLTVHFTGEVHPGACLTDPLHTYFTVVNGRGPQGVIAANFVLGSDRIHLQLDAPLEEADASGDPTYLRMRGGLMFHDMFDDWEEHECTPSAFVPDHHDNAQESREPWALRTQDERIVDETAPKILHAWTMDRDGNGELDGIDFFWSEPVRDSTFKEGNPGSTAVSLDVFGHLDYRRLDVGTENDEFLTITMKPRPELGFGTQRLPPISAEWKVVGGEPVGMVMDLSQDPDVTTRTAGNWMEPEVWELQNDTALHFTLLDRAPPRVMRAITMDRDEDGRIDAYKLIFSEPVRDTSFNAAHWRVIDMISQPPYEYTVTGVVPNTALNSSARPFDPFVNDNVLILALAERPQPTSVLPFGDTGFPILPPQVLYDPTAAPGGLEDMAGLPASLGGPNVMLAMDRGKVVEEDGARPVLIAALGCDNTNRVAGFFSEAVGVRFNASEPMRGVRETDLHYGNDNPGGATGLRNDTVIHELGSTRFDADTRGLLASGDFGSDFLQAQPDRTRNETVSVIQELNGPLRVKAEVARFARSADIFAPDRIDALRLRAYAAGMAHFEFEVPVDPGCTDRGTVGYVVRVQNLDANSTRINPTTVGRVPTVAPELVEYWWYDTVTEQNITGTPLQLFTDHGVGDYAEGDPLHTINVRINGLKAETRYEITLQPVDRYGNVGPMADPRTVNTTLDLTPPDPPAGFRITSTTHTPEGVTNKNAMPAFSWTVATDIESGSVWYVYALSSQSSQYQPSELRDLVTLESRVGFDQEQVGFFSQSPTGLAPVNWFDPPKQWHFIVAACSGGGCTTLGNYSFKVDSQVNATQVAAMHDGIVTTVVYEQASGDAVVTWSGEPDAANLPAGCQVAAVQLWRWQDDPTDASNSSYVGLGTFRMADQVYKDREYRDTSDAAGKNTRYLVTFGCEDSVMTYYRDLGNGTYQPESVQVLGAGMYPEGKSPNAANHPGTTASVKEKPFSPPWWVWVILAVLVLAIVAGIILFARAKRGSGEIWEDRTIDEATLQRPEGEEEVPEEAKAAAPVREVGGAYRPPNAAADEAAAAEAGEGPTHDIKCPKCKQQFQATGTFPLKVTCPHCGTSGTMR